MKRCPFLVAGLSMQTVEPRPGVIPITPRSEVTPPGADVILRDDPVTGNIPPASRRDSSVADLFAVQESPAVAASAECLGSTCRFFNAGGCRFDALFESQSQLQSATVAALQAGGSAGAAALSGDAATVLAAIPSTLEEVWSLQRESLREVMGGFRAIESAQATLQSGVATQVESQVGQVQVRVQQVGSQVGQVEAGIARLESLVATVEAQVQKFETQFGGVQTAVGRVQQDLTSVQTSVGRVQQDLSGVRDQVVQVETQVKTVAEAKPSIGPEILDLVGRHFETLERDMRQIEASVRAGLGDSLKAFVKESQTAAVSSAETSLRAVLEGVQAALRTSSQDSATLLRGLLQESQGTLRTALGESEKAMRSVLDSQAGMQATLQESQQAVQESQGALRSAMADSQTAMRTVIQESQAAIGAAAAQSQAAVREALTTWQPKLDTLVSRSSDDSRIQIEQALGRVVDELAAARDIRIQLQAALDGLTREAREVATVARRVESTQVLTHELLDEQRQVHQLVEARENRERARQLNNAGVLSYHQGLYDASVQRFREATELDPTLAEAFNNLGLSYTEMGREEEAVVAFQRAIELDPGSGQVYNNLGYLYYRKGDLTQAIEMYQRAIQRGTDTSSAYCNLGNAYYRLRRVDQAIQAWRRALEVDPANTKAAAALERLGMEMRPN